jgi:putative phage-type endonuclease
VSFQEDSARAAWLKERRQLITASDVPAILDLDPYRGPVQVWASKVHGLEPQENAPMRRGRRLEPVIAEEYSEETGRPLTRHDQHTLIRHPEIPWLACTPDYFQRASAEHPAPAEQAGSHVPLQLKAVGAFKAAEWQADPPQEYQVQVQIEMACTRSSWATLAALIGGMAIAWKDLISDDGFLEAAMPHLEEFRWRVLHKVAPQGDAKPGSLAAIKRLWSKSNGQTIPLDHADLELVEAWERASDDAGRKEVEAETLEARLKVRMADATFGALPDGSFLVLPTTDVRAHTQVHEAYSYRALRRRWPKVRRRS